MANIPGWLIGSAITLVAGALLYVARQLWKRWRDRIVDQLDQALRRKVTRFERRYRELMLSNLRFIDVKGLATVGFYTPELDEVFVDVSLAYRAPHQIGESVLTKPPADVTDRRSITEFLDHEKPVVLAMIGVPGSGKTTLLRHTARTLCRQPRGRRRTVPILLYLRDHAAKIVENPGIDLPKLVVDTLGRMGTTEPPGWFEQRLRDGSCVVLFDGLDEVARHENRTKVATWVARQTREYSRNDFVITSRPQGYRSAPIDGAVVVQVRSFTDEQVTRFLRDWYLAIEKHTTGETGADVQLLAQDAADDLLRRLDANPRLYDLTVNPLLLTMIANVHRFRGALPGSRTDLYGEICQVILSRRQEAKDLRIELSGEKKEALLRGLAFTMMRRQVRDLARADVHRELKPALRRLSTPLTENDLLADLSSNGLLIEREADLFSFAHLTFQEYLAAAHIRDKGLVQTLAESVEDVWWHETTLLFASRSDADSIVAACLASERVTALSLAFDIADQGRELAPELRRRLDVLLDGTGDDLALRRLRASVMIARHLRSQIRTGTGGRVYGVPISRIIYDVIRTDTGIPVPDGADGEPNAPVTGVRARDAEDFVYLVNVITGGEPGYRLPSRTEISDPAVQRALGRAPAFSVWLEPSGGPSPTDLWTPAGWSHPHRIDAETLARHVHTDFQRSKQTVARVLLLQSLFAVRALGRALIRAQDRDLDRARALARDLDRALSLAVELDRALAHTLARARTLTIDLNRDLAQTLDRTLAQTLYRTLIRALDRTVAHTLTLTVDRTLDTTLDLDLARVGFGIRFMGGALVRALAGTLRKAPPVEAWTREFARAFQREAIVEGDSWVVPLDAQRDTLRKGQEQLRALSDPTPSDWAYEVASRLERMALPVVTRQEPLTPDTATAIRVAALCLAVEADKLGSKRVGDTYREVAAGIR